MCRVFGIITFFAVLLSFNIATANELSAEQKYQTIKDQTEHSGSVGFDKRHKAYRKYIMESRQKDTAENVAKISPAAGEVEMDVNTKSETKAKPVQPKYND